MKIAGETKPGQIPYVEAQGSNIQEMREHLSFSPEGYNLIQRGDVVLVWVNQGDIDIHNMNVEFGAYTSDPDKGV